MSQLTPAEAFTAVEATHGIATASRISGIVGRLNAGQLTEAAAQRAINRVYTAEATRVDPYHTRLPAADDRHWQLRGPSGPDLGDVLAR